MPRPTRSARSPHPTARLGDTAVLAMQDAARRHLWLHFTRMSSYADGEVPVIVRGSGPVRVRPAGQALPGRAVRPVREPDRARPQGGRRGGRAAGAASWPTSRSGPTPTRGPSSWPSGSPPWPPATSTGCSSPPAAPRRSSRPGSWPSSTSRPSASRAGTRCSAATSPTTARRWARWPSPGCPAIKEPFEPLPAGRGPGAEHQLLPRARLRRRRPRGVRPVGGRRDRARHPARGPGIGGRRVPRAGAELRRLLPAAARLLRRGSARSATATACCSSPTRSSARSAGSATTSARSATATSRTSSPSPRA